MHRLLISTALVLLTAPAFAQPPDPTRGKGGPGQYQQQQQQKPQQQKGRAQRQQAAPPQQRQQAAPQQQRVAPQQQRAAPQNHGNRDVNRGGDRRPGYSGPRRDYSGFRDYRRSYNSPRRFRGPTYRRPPGWYDRRWTFGEFLPSLFWSSSYWLNDFNSYALPTPPYGTVWVRNGNDALLIDRDTGEIISVRYAVFY